MNEMINVSTYNGYDFYNIKLLRLRNFGERAVSARFRKAIIIV